MADSNVVKAFRARLKSRGYSNVLFERLYLEEKTDEIKYQVYVTEPLPSRERLHFVVTEEEMNDLLRSRKAFGKASGRRKPPEAEATTIDDK